MAKLIGYGSVLTVSTSTGGSVELGQVRSISGPSASGDAVDTTTLDSSTNYRTFAGGLVDPGDLTFDLVYDPDNSGHKRMSEYLGNRFEATWTIYHASSTGNNDAFSGFVNGLSREIPLDDLITANVTVKVTGDPKYST